MNKILAVILVFAAIAVAILLFTNYFPIGWGGANFADTSGVDPANFLTYRYPYGFEIAYPYSFVASTIDEEGNPVYAVFSANTEGYSEIMQIAITGDSIETLKAGVLEGLTAEEKRTLKEGEAFGAKIMSFEKNYNGADWVTQIAFFRCEPSSVIFTAVVPKELEGDLKNVNYMTSTFKC